MSKKNRKINALNLFNLIVLFTVLIQIFFWTLINMVNYSKISDSNESLLGNILAALSIITVCLCMTILGKNYRLAHKVTAGILIIINLYVIAWSLFVGNFFL